MPEITTEQQNEIEHARQVARYRKVRDAFVAIFGPPGKPTPQGAIILEELERFTNWTKPIREQDTTGQTDVYRTGIKEGRREVMQAIHNMISWKESEHVDSGKSGT